MSKTKVDVEALKKKFATYPNILRFIEQQRQQRSMKVLHGYLDMKEGDLSSHMGPQIHNFADLDAKCKVTMDKWDELRQVGRA